MIKQAIGMLILGSAFASGIAVAYTIDQSQENIDEPLQSGVNNLSGKLQGFQPTATNVAGGGFYFGRLYKDSTGAIVPVDMTIAVWNGLPGTGSQIASSTVQLSELGWLDAFWTSVSVTKGATYYLAVTTTGVPLDSIGNPANGGIEPAVSSDGGSSPYGEGLPGSFNPNANPLVGALGEGYDFAFRTYSDDAPSPVPLPAAAWLMLSGLAGLARNHEAHEIVEQ